MRRIKLLAVLFTVILASCVKQDDFSIVEVEELGLESLTKPIVTLRVRNDSRRTVRLLSGRFTVSTPAGKIGEVILTEEVVIPKKSETSVTLPLRMRISNPLAAAPLLSGKGVDAERLLVTGEVKVKAGAASRDFSVGEVPFSQFISIFNP